MPIWLSSFTEEEAPVPSLIASSKNGGNVREGHTVFLHGQETPNNSGDSGDVQLYYTTDGSNPVIGDSNTRLYTPEQGIRLETTGLSFIRAIAKMKGMLPSKALTSK